MTTQSDWEKVSLEGAEALMVTIPVVEKVQFGIEIYQKGFTAGRAHALKEVEEKNLRIENLSALLRRCFYWARNRESSIACEKIADLSNNAQHLLTPVSVLRDENSKEV